LQVEAVKADMTEEHIPIDRIVRSTLAIKSRVVTSVTRDEQALAVEFDVWKRRRLPRGTCGHLCHARDRLKETSREFWKYKTRTVGEMVRDEIVLAGH
jgi:hypothetical protein